MYDSTGVVGTDSAAVIAALDELYESTRSQLFVVIVDRFTGAADDQSWVDTSAELSGLGDADALLAIAVDDRTFRWSVSESYPLSDAALDEIAQERLVPEQDRNTGAPDYRPDGVVRVLGAGELSEEQGAALTDAERRSML